MGKRMEEKTEKKSEKSDEFIKYLERRFGITLPENLRIRKGGKFRIYNKELEELEEECGIKGVERFGVNAGSELKPSSDFLQLFGFMCTRNIVFLEKEELSSFLEGKKLELKEEQIFGEDGYVVVFFKGKVIGCGLLRGKTLESVIPKYKRGKIII